MDRTEHPVSDGYPDFASAPRIIIHLMYGLGLGVGAWLVAAAAIVATDYQSLPALSDATVAALLCALALIPAGMFVVPVLAAFGLRRRDARLIAAVMRRVNDAVTEVTGDPSQRLSRRRVLRLLRGKEAVTLRIGGGAGAELRSVPVPNREGERRVALVVPAADNGVARFDRMLESAMSSDPLLRAAALKNAPEKSIRLKDAPQTQDG